MKNKTQVHKWKEMQTEQNIIALRGIIHFYLQAFTSGHSNKR